MKKESAGKPGSVVEQSFILSTRRRVLQAANPGTARTTPMFPYLALLQVGFALPRMLPSARCALTAPFHPYLVSSRKQAVYFLWHFPSARAAQALPGTLSYGARTFLHIPAEAGTQRLSG